MWGCFLMSGVKILHFLKDWWKSIPIHQNYTMALTPVYFLRYRIVILPYFGKQKQVTYYRNLSYWCFCILPSVLFFQAKFYASTLILLKDMLGKTSWYS